MTRNDTQDSGLIRATYLCGACGCVASIVTLVEPGQPDPLLTPEPPDVPPGVSTLSAKLFPDESFLAIDGGPVSLTLGPAPLDRATSALRSGDPAALYLIDFEYAPFWCPSCRASYCRDHYRRWAVYDDGFFDCIRGECPAGHERMLMD
ncbi:MAG: hypothetical protein H0U52_08300 [Chloroflexi bacterium]|nr:hypothetical protein [Chloroflexota bacterium]